MSISKFNLTDCDILLIAGDICDYHGSVVDQIEWTKRNLIPWLNDIELSGTKVLFIPGNHDWCMKQKSLFDKCASDCLIDNEVELDGLKIYGTPYTKKFCFWAFMENEKELVKRYAKIPENLDILLVHGPPYGVCDRVNHKENPLGECLGSTALRQAILDKKPKRVFFGHIHTGLHSDVHMGESICRNVSFLNEEYFPTYEPFTFELNTKKG